jgi:hypothetical protein
MIEQTDEEFLAMAKRKNLRTSAREPARRARLHRLIVSKCTMTQIANDLGVSLQHLRYLIIANGFSRIWADNKEQRAKERAARPKIVRHRLRATRPVLQEFEKRGYKVKYAVNVDDCRVEGFPVSVYYPKKLGPPKTGKPDSRYFIIESKYLDRFCIVILPNGKKTFRWPMKKERKYLCISEKELIGPEIWPSKGEFRRRRQMARGEEVLKRKKRLRKRKNDLLSSDWLKFQGIIDDFELTNDIEHGKVDGEDEETVLISESGEHHA